MLQCAAPLRSYKDKLIHVGFRINEFVSFLFGNKHIFRMRCRHCLGLQFCHRLLNEGISECHHVPAINLDLEVGIRTGMTTQIYNRILLKLSELQRTCRTCITLI